MNWGECYFDHYVTHFGGAPTWRRVIGAASGGLSIQVLAFERVVERTEVLLASVGTSHVRYRGVSPCEVFLVADVPALAELGPDLLAGMLLTFAEHGIPVTHGVALPLAGEFPEYAEDSGRHALYVTQPEFLSPRLERVPCGGQEGRLHIAVFLTRAEYEYLREHGVDELETLLEQSDVDILDSRRPSAV